MEQRKKIAAILTTYFPASHADVIVTKFLKGFPTDDGLISPNVDIVSMYMDQIHENDIGIKLANHYGVPIYTSIRKALTLDSRELAVDGVILIGEHGDYPLNKKEHSFIQDDISWNRYVVCSLVRVALCLYFVISIYHTTGQMLSGCMTVQSL